jgi:hypothetical protein
MSKRILVVEDQPDNRQIIRDMLAGTDYEITEAEDGEQALTAGNTPLPVTHTGHPPTMFRYNVAGQLRILGAILYGPPRATAGHTRRKPCHPVHSRPSRSRLPPP